MHELYQKSRLLAALGAFVFLSILFLPEPGGEGFVVAAILSLVIYVIGFLSEPISRAYIWLGDKLTIIYLKIGFYFFMLPWILFSLFNYIDTTLYEIESHLPSSSDFSTVMSQGLKFAFLETLAVIILIAPYIQTIIVLILKKIEKNEKN